MQAYFLVGYLDLEPGRHYASFRTSGIDNPLTWRQAKGSGLQNMQRDRLPKLRGKKTLTREAWSLKILDGVTVTIECTCGDSKKAGGQFVMRLAQCY